LQGAKVKDDVARTHGFDLLRLDGFMSMEIEEIDGKLYVDVVPSVFTHEPTCECDDPDVVKHGTRVVHFRDHPIQRMETYLRIKRQRYRCRSCGAVLLDDLPFIDPKRNMTIRFRDQLAEDGTKLKFSLSGDINGVKESLVRRVFKDHARERLKNYTYDLPRVMGMDEKYMGGQARFVVGDVENRVLLDILDSRRKEVLVEYFQRWTHQERMKVEVITQDMHWAYKELNEQYFKASTVVVDRFHVVRYADYAVSNVRKAIQNSVSNEDRIALKGKIGLLAARPHRLKDDDKLELKRVFRQHPAIETAVTLKEWFYDIYNAESRAEAEKAYEAWRELLPKEFEPAFKAILSFMRNKRWHNLIFNYFDARYTNGYVEGVNSLLDEIARGGRGYDLETLRAKALLKYGNVKPLIDLYDFKLTLGDPETDIILSTTVGHGVDLSTFEYALKAGDFW
jgi:transposase